MGGRAGRGGLLMGLRKRWLGRVDKGEVKTRPRKRHNRSQGEKKFGVNA
jgi:hypothetical protein